MMGALGACVTNTTPEQRQQIRNIEKDRLLAQATVRDYHRCDAKVISKYSNTALGRKLGIQDVNKQPYSAAQLANDPLITKEESQEYLAYNLKSHNCVEVMIRALTRYAPQVAEMLRRYHNKWAVNLGDLLSRNITVGQYLSHDKKNNAAITAEFKAVWPQIENSNPRTLPVPSSRTKQQIQKPVTSLSVPKTDLNFVAYSIKPSYPNPSSPLDLAIFGGNAAIISDHARSAAQVFIKRKDDTFTFRLFLRLPPEAFRILDALPVEQSYYTVRTTFQKGKASSSTLSLGIVNLRKMDRRQESMGTVLDSGWIHAPGEREIFKSDIARDTKSRERFETNYSYIATRRTTRPMYMPLFSPANGCRSGCDNGIELSWVPASEMDRPSTYGKRLTPRSRLSAQMAGDQALTALDNGEEIFRQAFASQAIDQQKREEISAWMKANIRTVSPHGVMYLRCGKVPDTSKSSFPIFGTDEQQARVRKKLDYFYEHEACVETLQTTYDPAPYQAIYPQIEAKKQEWRAAGGKLKKRKTPTPFSYIPGFLTVQPKDAAKVFEQRLAVMADPNLDVKRMAREYAADARRHARNRARQAEDERKADLAEARRAQQFIQGQLAQNQQILNAVQAPQIPTQTSSGGATTTITTTTTTSGPTTETVTKTTTGQQANALPPVINGNFYRVLADAAARGSGDPCAFTSNILGGDISRVTCKIDILRVLPYIHRYYCNAPEGSPIVEAFSASPSNGIPIRLVRYSGLTAAQRDRLYETRWRAKMNGQMIGVDTTDIFAYRAVEEDYLNRRDENGRQIYFRTEADIIGTVPRVCGRRGDIDWDAGKRRHPL